MLTDTIKIIVSSTLFFYFLNNKIFKNLKPEKCTKIDQWKNTCTSCSHALIVSLGALLVFYKNPDVYKDQFWTTDENAVIVGAILFGYMIYDWHDLVKTNLHDITILLHHSVVMFCNGWAIFKHHHHGYLMVAMVMEMQSVFLHLRQLLNFAKISRKSYIYRSVSVLNFITMFTFRFVPNYLLTIYSYEHQDELPYWFFVATMFVMAFLFGNNGVLVYRLVKSDLLSKRKSE